MKIKYVQGLCCQHNMLCFFRSLLLLCSSLKVETFGTLLSRWCYKSHTFDFTRGQIHVWKKMFYMNGVFFCRGPVFCVGLCWTLFLMSASSVLCVITQLIYEGRDWMKNCVIYAFPLNGKCSCEQMSMHANLLDWESGFPIICCGTRFTYVYFYIQYNYLFITNPCNHPTTVYLCCCISSRNIFLYVLNPFSVGLHCGALWENKIYLKFSP